MQIHVVRVGSRSSVSYRMHSGTVLQGTAAVKAVKHRVDAALYVCMPGCMCTLAWVVYR